jgi:hypothetical protein
VLALGPPPLRREWSFDWLSGGATEEDALGRYHRDRDEDVLADWTQCTSLARDISQLAAA